MTIEKKISELRAIMFRENLDALIISGTDPHNSEYLPGAWKQREWISGFTGSYGTVVVCKNGAGLWTDSRYFIQAEQQLKDTEIQLYRLKTPGIPDYPEWIIENLPHGSRVGIDYFCISIANMQKLNELFKRYGLLLIDCNTLLGEIWLDRPALPESPIYSLSSEITGRSVEDKIYSVRQVLFQNQANYFIFSTLDEIAWLYNIRCHDIDYNPVAISYAVIGIDKAYLFIKQNKVSQETHFLLKQAGIEVQDYHHLFLFLEKIDKESTFCADYNTLNYAIYNKIKSQCGIKNIESPIILAKAIKNQTEIDGFRRACLKDGIALTKFFYWLENHLGNHLTETLASEQLTKFRAMDNDYVSDSFSNISAYEANAALPHYSAVSGKDATLLPRGLYLVDSGGQYRCGTTDVTRTIPLGTLTQQEKEDYTIVLKGMIALTCAIFPEGTRGCNLDAIARQPLWHTRRNYGHGTGHGIGFFLNVHEGPQAIRQDLKDQAILPGMVTSNEPGLYREGLHGIRHENMLLCVPVSTNEFGSWLGFETLTICYFDTSALCIDLLSQTEIEWINNYNQMVYNKLSPHLSSEEIVWLAQKTKKIS